MLLKDNEQLEGDSTDDGFVLAIGCFHGREEEMGSLGLETPEAQAEVQGHSELPCSVYILRSLACVPRLLLKAFIFLK